MAAPVLQGPIRERYWAGQYRITGVIDRLGVVGPYVVRLYSRSTGRFLAQGLSAANGAYSFDFMAYSYRGYFVVGHDNDTGSPVNAAIADLITPEPMP